MKNFIFATALLLLCAVGVWVVYETYVIPEAGRLVVEARQSGSAAPQVFVVIIKDWEQQICITLALWCLILLVAKYWGIFNDNHLYNIDFLGAMIEAGDGEDEKQTLRKTMKEIDELPEKITATPVIQALLASIRRYLMTDDVHSTSEAISLSMDALALRQEAGNTMIRYVIWAIPSFGFIGTVRGIGQALTQADEALKGDITLMTDSLGVAFNSTLVALCLSIPLMLLLHGLQRFQDDQLINTQEYCEKFLLNRVSK
ncbi:MotA/TolQ/ExbB proton channel family protein [Sneathiella sp.]|uniref:MotA/TolQ/ExbB proton channel family protein n=1 Tax=Sneathiella sp. TaxID=1964365 RepID=UPI003566BB92